MAMGSGGQAALDFMGTPEAMRKTAEGFEIIGQITPDPRALLNAFFLRQLADLTERVEALEAKK